MRMAVAVGVAVLLAAGAARADTAQVPILRLPGGEPLGTIALEDSRDGLVIRPELSGLPPGLHGMHVHHNGNCSDPGDHYDPAMSGRHGGPRGGGHLGDLPQLEVDGQGRAGQGLLAPRLNLDEVRGRALVIHDQADNYADQSGGPAIACGVVP